MKIEHKIIPRIEKERKQDDFYQDFYNSPIYQRALKHFAKDWYEERIKQIEVKIENQPKTTPDRRYLDELYKIRMLHIKSLSLFGVEYQEPKRNRKITNPYIKK